MNASQRDRRSLLRGRIATSLLFLLFGAAQGVWTSRIPGVKSRLDLSDGRLSLALLAFSVGSIVGMLVLGRLVDRWGSSRVIVPAALLEGLLLIPPAYMPSLAGLMLALLLFGSVHGSLDTCHFEFNTTRPPTRDVRLSSSFPWTPCQCLR